MGFSVLIFVVRIEKIKMNSFTRILFLCKYVQQPIPMKQNYLINTSPNSHGMEMIIKQIIRLLKNPKGLATQLCDYTAPYCKMIQIMLNQVSADGRS